MNLILIGYGNIGRELEKVLKENSFTFKVIVKSNGIFDANKNKIDEKENLPEYIDKNSVVFICVPSRETSDILNYYLQSLKAGASIVTCEKAIIANHWDLIQKYPNKIRYSACVGGGSGILNAISEFGGDIQEIQAVVNGTLNYISDKLDEGVSKKDIFIDVTNRGFSEPGATSFNEVIAGELKDVSYKTAILANHSKLYKNIFKPRDISLGKFSGSKRCLVLLKREGILAGFVEVEDKKWFPYGVNNVLYINNKKIVEGPGAGARATAERMLMDFRSLNEDAGDNGVGKM